MIRSGFFTSYGKSKSRLRDFFSNADAATAALAGVIDPYFSYVVSLLHFEGANNSTVVTDQISKTWTFGGSGKISTSAPLRGTSSAALSRSTSDYIYTADANSLDLAGVDYSIEFLYNPTSLPQDGSRFDRLVSKGVNNAAGYHLFLFNYTIYYRNNLTEQVTPVAHGMAAGSTYHIHVGRQGSTNYLHINGVQKSTGSGTISDNSDQLFIGAISGASQHADGKFDEFRITKGYCRYTASFTPPTDALPDA